jgi:putative transposase
MNILTLFACCSPLISTVSIARLADIAQAVLTMTGRITMLGISRWSEKGNSYRTIQRFYAAKLPWAEMLAEFVRHHLFNPNHEYILAGDATTVTKSGSETHGINRFFSGCLGAVVKGLEFFVISLIDVERRESYPLAVNQTVRNEAEKEALKRRKFKSKNKLKKLSGRPKGVLNKDKTKLNLSSELLRINDLLKTTMKLIKVFVSVKYLALDGHFGHNQAVLTAQSTGLELISKLRKDAAVFEKYEGKYGGKGAKKRYGERISYEKLPTKYLKKSEKDKENITNYYHGIFLSKSFSGSLYVVIIEKINVKKEKIGHAILFDSDEKLGWEKLIEYYRLRFQIEFNFRDAKQHFGLEDFMNTTENGVENAANISFMMVNLSAKLLKERGENCIGINDLKSRFRGVKYAVETIKLIQPKAEMILIEKVKAAISRIGSIHRHKISVFSA